jgi:hypothetical protein
MINLPNEIVNLILSFREISPICEIMRKSIDEYNNMMNEYKKRTKFHCYYFHVIIRYKIDQIIKIQEHQKNHKIHRKEDQYEVIEDELWMLDYYGGDFDISILSTIIKSKIKGKISFRNMDFRNGYRTKKLMN